MYLVQLFNYGSSHKFQTLRISYVNTNVCHVHVSHTCRHGFILSLGNQYFSLLILIYVIYTFILNVDFCIVCAVQLPLLPESQSFRSFSNKFSKKSLFLIWVFTLIFTTPTWSLTTTYKCKRDVKIFRGFYFNQIFRLKVKIHLKLKNSSLFEWACNVQY